MTTFEVSQRRACAVVEQPRSTQRLPRVVPAAPERRLRARLRELANVIMQNDDGVDDATSKS